MSNQELDRLLQKHKQHLAELRELKSEILRDEWAHCRVIERLREQKAARNLPAKGAPF